MKRLLFCLLSVFVTSAAQGGPMSAVDVTGQAGYFTWSQAPGTMTGWTFTVTQDTSVERLGYFDRNDNGLQASHEIGIWDSGGSLLTSGVVPSGAGGDLIDRFRYVDVADVLLTPGSTYTIGGHTAPQVDAMPNTPTFQHAPGISYTGTVTKQFSTFAMPTDAVGQDYLAVNFQFAQVPEPSSALCLALTGIGFLVRRRRIRDN